MALDLSTDENKAELQKLIQSETDKVRTKYSGEMKGLQDQITQLSMQNMTAQQKAEFENQQREATLKQRETDLNKKLLAIDTKGLLTEKGLGAELEALLTADTIEGRKAQLEVLVKTLNLKVKDEVVKKIGNEPGTGNVGTKGAADYDWNEMSYSDRVALYQSDQKLYEEVKKQGEKKK